MYTHTEEWTSAKLPPAPPSVYDSPYRLCQSSGHMFESAAYEDCHGAASSLSSSTYSDASTVLRSSDGLRRELAYRSRPRQSGSTTAQKPYSKPKQCQVASSDVPLKKTATLGASPPFSSETARCSRSYRTEMWSYVQSKTGSPYISETTDHGAIHSSAVVRRSGDGRSIASAGQRQNLCDSSSWPQPTWWGQCSQGESYRSMDAAAPHHLYHQSSDQMFEPAKYMDGPQTWPIFDTHTDASAWSDASTVSHSADASSRDGISPESLSPDPYTYFHTC